MARKFVSIKKLSAQPELLVSRINSLKKIILENNKVSKSAGSITINLNEAEFESIVDCLERLQKNVFLESENRKLKKEIGELDKKLDDKAWNELIAIEWAKKAIPPKGAKLEEFKEAVYRIGVEKPPRGRPREHDPQKEIEFHNMNIDLMKRDNDNITLTTQQKEKAVRMVKKQFDHLSYNATYQYLYENGAKNLPWQKKQ
jgi:hypothetical protein